MKLLLRIWEGVYKLYAQHLKAVFIYHSLNKTLRVAEQVVYAGQKDYQNFNLFALFNSKGFIMFEYQGNFYGVGQGLFASGLLKFENNKQARLSYIYDCGTNRSHQKLIEQLIDKAIDELDTHPLDLLFISHLHWDHVLGLEYLLKKIKSVTHVILPYFYPAERAVILENALENSDFSRDTDGWYITFLTAPANFLKEHGAENIYFVRGGDGTEPISLSDLLPHEPTKNESNNNDFENKHIPISILPSNIGNIKDCKSKEIQANGDSLDDHVEMISSRSIIYAKYWFFALFNKDVDDNALAKFYKEFDNIRTINSEPDKRLSLAEVLKEKCLTEKVKKAYEKLAGENKLNESSLAVLSACNMMYFHKATHILFDSFCTPSPWREYYLQNHSYCILDECIQKKLHRCRQINSDTPRLGIIFTGDLPVNKLWNALSRKFGLDKQGDCTKVLVYQVPHHGSKGNWHIAQAEIEPAPIYVLSAGIKNRYRHPSAQVLRDICQHNRKLIWVHEGQSFSQKFTILQK